MGALVEKLAQVSHEQWVRWAKQIQDEVSPERRARWQQFFVAYEELPEEVKEVDRVYAQDFLDVLISCASGSVAERLECVGLQNYVIDHNHRKALVEFPG